LSASAGGAELRWGCWAALGRLGLGGLGCYGLRVWFSFFFPFPFSNPNLLKPKINYKQPLNSNQDLNPTIKNNAPACMQQ
jgi:hypothetical protein